MHAHACRAAMTSAENPVWSGQIVAVFDDVPLVGLRMQLPSTIDEIPMQTDTAAVTPFWMGSLKEKKTNEKREMNEKTVLVKLCAAKFLLRDVNVCMESWE